MQAESAVCRRTMEQIASGAVGLADASPATELAAHLSECPACSTEAATHARIGRLLAVAVPSVEPSPTLRQRVLAAALSSPESPIAAEPRGRAPGRLLSFPRLLAERGSVRRLSLAAAAAVLLLVVGLTVETLQLRSELQSEQEARRGLEERLAANDVIVSELARPGFATKELQGAGPAATASARLYLNPTSSTAVLMATGLHPPVSGYVYQLWLVKDGHRTSGGTFTTDETGNGTLVITAPEPLSGYQTVGVTIEPAGGSPGPTGARVLGGSL
jgi:hypothetical protein